MRINPLKSSILCLSAWLFFPLLLHSQLVPELYGARSAASGMASATLSDVWAIQNNIGALAGLEQPSLAFGYNTRLNIQELTTFGALLGWPLRRGVAAASFTRFGTGAFHIQTAGLGFSHQIQYISLGVKINYLQQVIEGFESIGTVTVEAGGKAELFPNLHFAAHAYNLTQSSYSTPGKKELLPVLLKAGLAYLPTDQTQFYIQTLKDLEYPARFSAGLNYQVIEALSLRTGIMTAPVVASFGIGFSPGRFGFDYAFRHHNTIGVAHHLTIGYSLNTEERP